MSELAKNLSTTALMLVVETLAAKELYDINRTTENFEFLCEKRGKLETYIAELEGENKKAFDFVKTLRTYCIYAHWDNPDTKGEFNEFDAEICKWLSEFTERER